MSLFDMTASTNVRKLMVLNSEFPKDLEVINSDTATFVADISEHGRPAEYTYQWYVNEEMVNDATTAVYIRDTTADKGVYSVHCVITNKAGSVKTRTATLTVNALPTLDSSEIVNATIAVGESKTYKVSVSEHGYPKSYTYQWYLNGSKISGATSPTYDYVSTALGKATLYCKVTNSAGTVTSRTATIAATTDYIVKNGQTSYSSYISSSNSSALSVFTSSGELYLKSTSYGYHTIGLSNIDLSNAKTLHLEGQWDHTEKGYSIEIYIASTSGSKLASKTIATPGTAYSFNFDVSGISGKCNLLGYFTYKGTWRIKNAYLQS